MVLADIDPGAAAPDEDEDNCIDRHDADDDTPDEELPAARGGVANV